MDNKSFDINSLRVASPCSVGWETMSGDDRVRHCQSCQLNIYNTAEMTPSEVYDLISNREARLCIRLFKRADGTVITKDCPVGYRVYQKRVARYAGAALTAILGLFSVSFAQKQDEKSVDASKVEIVRTANEKLETDLTGTVLDANGAVVPDAECKLFKIGDKKSLKTKSNEDGIYRFANLGVGIYRLEVRYSGFKTFKVVGIEVKDSEIVSIGVFLEADGKTVTVGIYSEEPLIDTTSSSITTTITHRQIQGLPH